MKFAKQLLETYRELLRILDEERKGHEGRDYYERIIDTKDSTGSSITRMRARGIIDPEVCRAYEETITKEVSMHACMQYQRDFETDCMSV